MVVAMPAALPSPMGRAFSRADLVGMPEDGRRYEIVDGLLIVSGAPGRLHQRAVGRIYRILDDACPPALEVLMAPFAVGLTDDTEIQPDLLVARQADLTERDLPTAPLLAVEVLSHSTRLIDINVKRDRLFQAGALAFWALDPVARSDEARLRVWQQDPAGRNRLVADVTGSDSFEATVPFPARVVPAELVRSPSVT